MEAKEILWRILFGMRHRIRVFCGACTLVRHRIILFCGAWAWLRHRIKPKVTDPCVGVGPAPILWRIFTGAPQKLILWRTAIRCATE